MSFPKLCITVGDGAHVQIVEIFESDEVKALSIPETRIEIENDANVKYQQIQANQRQIWQLGRLDISVGKQSEFNGATVGLGGAYSRMEQRVVSPASEHPQPFPPYIWGMRIKFLTTEPTKST